MKLKGKGADYPLHILYLPSDALALPLHIARWYNQPMILATGRTDNNISVFKMIHNTAICRLVV